MLNAWYVPVLLRVLLIDLGFRWFTKGKVLNENFIERFFLQYFFAAVLAVAYAAFMGQIVFDSVMVIIIVIGAFNGYGAYCSWRAQAINLSAMSVFSFLDDFTSVSLGYSVLKEAQYLNAGISAGLALCISAIAIFAMNNYTKYKADANSKFHLPLRFFMHVLSYSLIWGVATFLQRYYALKGIEAGTWMAGWYFGAFLMASGLFLWHKKEAPIKAFRESFTHSNVGLMIISCVLIMLNIYLTFWALQLAPLTVVQPIFFTTAMIMPVLLGLLVFKEGEQYDPTDKLLFVQTIVGAILIAFSFGRLHIAVYFAGLAVLLIATLCIFRESKILEDIKKVTILFRNKRTA